jgi:hypothetical protein
MNKGLDNKSYPREGASPVQKNLKVVSTDFTTLSWEV